MSYSREITTRNNTVSLIKATAKITCDGEVFLDLFKFDKLPNGELDHSNLPQHISIMVSEFPQFAEFIATINRVSRKKHYAKLARVRKAIPMR